MKKIIVLIFISVITIISACKKNYTFLNAKLLNKIPLKNPITAVGNFKHNNKEKKYIFSPSISKSNFDYKDNNLLVSDTFSNRVLMFQNNGKISLIIHNKKKLNKSFYKTPESAPDKKIPDNIKVIKYGVNNPGVVISDSEGNIYVETNKKAEQGKMPFHFILKFDSEGEFLYKIGNDGKDGLIFPDNELITSLYTDNSNNLYVISKYRPQTTNRYKPLGTIIRVYNNNGKFLFKIRSHVLLKNIKQSGDEMAIIENLVPAPVFNSFLFSVAIYKKAQGGKAPELDRKELYKINYVSNKIEKVTEFPEKDLSLLAATNNSKIYLNTANGRNLDIVIININGKVLKRNRLNFFSGQSKFLTYNITPEGKIIGVFFDGANLNFIGWL